MKERTKQGRKKGEKKEKMKEGCVDGMKILKRTKERLEYGFPKKKYQNQVMAWFY